ncbi:TPA: type 4 pilus major pilin [Stenotrophomonas maltophilia]
MSAPRPTKLAQACAHAHGFGLVEVLLVLGVASAISVAAWLVFGPASVAADVKQTQMDFSETATAIDRSLGIVGGFSGLSTSLVRTDGLAAQRLRQGEALRNVWGGSVSFVANTVRRGNDSFLVETRDVPKAACAKLVAAMAGDPAVWDAQVNGESVYVGNKYDPATAAAACQTNGGDRLGFVYFSGLASGSSVAVSAIALPPALVAVTPANPATPVTPVNGAPSVGNAAPGTPGVVTPGTPVAPPPAVPTAPPAPATPTTPQPTPAVLPPDTPPDVKLCAVPPTQTQNVTCPAGQIGTVTQQRIGYCGAPTGPVYAAGGTLVYESWGVAGYLPAVTTSNTCAPACIAPASSSVAITRSAPAESQNVGCPAGQTGEHWQQRTQVENGTRTTSWACPAATGSPVSSTSDSWSGTYSAASGWVTTSNTCATPAPTLDLDASCGFVGAQTDEAPETWNGGCVQAGRFYLRTSPVSAVFGLRSTIDLGTYAIQWSGDCVGTASACTAPPVNVSVNSPHDRTATVTVTHRATGQQFTKTVTAQWRVRGIGKGGD